MLQILNLRNPFSCSLYEPDDKDCENGMSKQTSELLTRTGKQGLALSARNIDVKF